MAYSGDSLYCDSLVKLCRDADVAILDCSFPENEPGAGHLHAGECGRVAQKPASTDWCCRILSNCRAVRCPCTGRELLLRASSNGEGSAARHRLGSLEPFFALFATEDLNESRQAIFLQWLVELTVNRQ